MTSHIAWPDEDSPAISYSESWLGGDSVLLLPWWPGLLGNSVFYGAGLGALIAAWRGGVRMRRARRGRCIKCGYDLRSLPPGTRCPECGAAPRRHAALPEQSAAS